MVPNDSSRITSPIDFQSESVLPAFLQARWPRFLKPPQNYPKGFVQPKPPDNFDELDEDDKTITQQEFPQAKLAKAYEVSTYLKNRPAHNAMNMPRVSENFSSAVARFPRWEFFHFRHA